MRYILALIIGVMIMSSAQASGMNLDPLGRLPIYHEGRVKPLASFAIVEYKKLQDSAYADPQTALIFLAQALFDPSEAAENPVIAVRNSRTRSLLGLDADRKYFSLSELVEPLSKHDQAVSNWLQQDTKNLSKDQADLLRVYDTTVGLTQILRSFTCVLPLTAQLSSELSERYGLPSHNLAYLDFVDSEEAINRDVKKTLASKGDDFKRYNEDEQVLVYLSYQLQEIRTAGAGNAIMRILPSGWDVAWYSPWDMLLLGKGSPEAMKTLGLWRNLATNYRDQNEAQFTRTGVALAKRMMFQPEVHNWRLWLEQVYGATHPITLSLLLYLLALILAQTSKIVWAHRIILCAATLHGLSIIVRVAILGRPPVSTLFESTLFAGFIAVVAALFAKQKIGRDLSITIASIGGLVLQLTTLGFAQNGDTLQVLQAVLNTPFWLATHVIIITMGYGFCILLALLAHADLWWRGMGRDTKTITAVMPVMAVVALLFTAVGTILGGLWADQSWGRFWGWDPKENGALLIVLWLTWIMHGKLSGHIKPIAYSAGCAALTVIVAVAWFGVNLLSTGLHSYGFISGVAGSLATYLLLQCVVIGALWRRAYLKARHAY